LAYIQGRFTVDTYVRRYIRVHVCYTHPYIPTLLIGRGRDDQARLMFSLRHTLLVTVGNAPYASGRMLFRALNLLLIAQALAYRQDAFIGYSEKHSTADCSLTLGSR